MRRDGMDTVVWWHVVVGCVLVAMLAAWTLSVAQRTQAPRMPFTEVPMAAFLTLATAAAFLVCYLTQDPETSAVIGIVALTGWALLAGGLALVGALSSSRASLARLALVVAAFAVMYDAYHREGGWPGVAGWEYMGMQSPLVMSTSVALVVVLATPIGALIATVAGRLVLRRGGQTPARSIRPLTD